MDKNLTNAKTYLNQARLLDQRINAKLERIARLRSLTEKITVTLSPVAGAGSPNPTALEDQIIRLMEAEEDLNADIDRLVDLKKEIDEVLKMIDDPDCRLVLDRRYLCGDSWNEIADLMNFQRRTLFKIHDRALLLVDEILQGETYRKIHENWAQKGT